MIQFNLLPDVKQQYIKAHRAKRMVMVIAGLSSAVVLTVFIALFMVVRVAQKQHLGNLNQDIQATSGELQQIPELSKILTVQNQLRSLPELHDGKPVASRLFGYLSQITPTQISIAKLNVDFAANTMIISGDADALSTVNKFVDTIKFTDFSGAGQDGSSKAFSDVVLSSFNRDDQRATYEINLAFDPAIFNSTSNGSLTVPKNITTRSEIEKPDALFRQTAPDTAN